MPSRSEEVSLQSRPLRPSSWGSSCAWVPLSPWDLVGKGKNIKDQNRGSLWRTLYPSALAGSYHLQPEFWNLLQAAFSSSVFDVLKLVSKMKLLKYWFNVCSNTLIFVTVLKMREKHEGRALYLCWEKMWKALIWACKKIPMPLFYFIFLEYLHSS